MFATDFILDFTTKLDQLFVQTMFATDFALVFTTKLDLNLKSSSLHDFTQNDVVRVFTTTLDQLIIDQTILATDFVLDFTIKFVHFGVPNILARDFIVDCTTLDQPLVKSPYVKIHFSV